jgi:hypothetical protein
MEWGQQMKQHEEVSRNAQFHNTNYMNNREKKIPLIIDIKESSDTQLGLSDNADFSVNLMEPLIIDELSDVFLDSCMTINSNFGNNAEDMAICIKINQFNNNTRAASSASDIASHINNALIIPNEYNSLANHNEMHVHKGKKMNYICSINPIRLRTFTGKITNLSGSAAFPKRLDFISCSATSKAMKLGTPINVSSTGTVSGTLAVDHVKGTTDLYYYVTNESGTVDYSTGTIHITGFTTLSVNSNTHIAGIPPRLMLELIIVNRTR